MTETGSYLARHLVEILKHGAGGKHPPCAWIYRKDDGLLAHTFNPDIANGRESYGGNPIPILCLSDDGTDIFEPKKEAVKKYLQTFGINPIEAEIVLAARG